DEGLLLRVRKKEGGGLDRWQDATNVCLELDPVERLCDVGGEGVSCGGRQDRRHLFPGVAHRTLELQELAAILDRSNLGVHPESFVDRLGFKAPWIVGGP